MTAKNIQDKLAKKFETHKYVLNNSYIYDWECDFFSTTTSGYHTEIEIKLSYSDFKADARKIDKHRVLKAKFEGVETLLYKHGKMYEYTYEETKTLIGDNGKRVWDEDKKAYKQVGTGLIRKNKIQASEVHIKNLSTYYHNFEYKEISTCIEIKPLPKCPNKMYYICPTGIIPKEEVPEYCGLYYISESGRITEIKKAPFIHKEQLNLDKVLLDKFYYRSINLENQLKL